MKSKKQIDKLRQAIMDGSLSPGEMIGTEFAFSEQWGVARSTVRRGIDILIQEGLLERRAGKGLFVRPARAPDVRTIQVVVPNLAWVPHVKIARGAQLAGHEYGVETVVFDAHGQMRRDLAALRRLPETKIDGAIIVSLHHRKFSEVLFELKSKRFPFVLIGEQLRDLEIPTVVEDNYGGGYLIGQKLAAAGHRRAAFVGPLDLHVITDRLNGFRDAMLDAWGSFDRSLVVNLEGENLADWLTEKVNTAEELLMPLLTRSDRPTAVFDGSADIVPFVYRAAARANLRIPRDISVVAFDDSPFSQFVDPEVTRLRHPMVETGRVALEMLLDQINSGSKGGQKKAAEVRTLPPDWVPGPSLAPPSDIGRHSLKSG